MIKLLVLQLILLVAFGASRTPKSEYVRIMGFAQGTSYQVTYENSNEQDYSEAIDSLLKAFDKSCSIYDSTSIISRINNNDPTVEADDWFIDVFKKSVEVSALSGGALDITVGPVVRAWGFGNQPFAKHSKSQIDSLLQYIGTDKVKLVGRKVVKKFPEIMLDVNAVAQGYSVDVVSSFLEKKGIRNYLIEIGGEVRCKGTNEQNRLWRVAIDRPSEDNIIPGQQLQAIAELKNKSMTTAGNYRRFFIENGVKYGHTIDPKTGYPAKNTMLSATVVANDAATADAWDTAFMVLGIEKSKKIASTLKGIDVYFIYSNSKGEYEIYCSNGLKKMIVQPK